MRWEGGKWGEREEVKGGGEEREEGRVDGSCKIKSGVRESERDRREGNKGEGERMCDGGEGMT